MPFERGQQSAHGNIGKICFLPPDIREEVNRRIYHGESTREIAAWLNSLSAVQAVLEERWKGQPINYGAVETWRQKGYKEWLSCREKIENLKELSEYALRLGQAAGGSIADGSAAIAGGKIMAALETATGDDLHKMVRSITALRAGETAKARLEQGREKLELERKRYQRQTTELFLDWYESERARAIVESRDSNEEKIEALGRAMFGEAW